MADRSVSVTMTSSDLKRREAIGQISQACLLNNARTLWPRMTKFGSLTQVGELRISRVIHAPTASGWDPRTPQFWGSLQSSDPSTYAYSLWRRTAKFDVVTHTTMFWGVSHATVTKGRIPSVPIFEVLWLHPLTQNTHVPQGNTWERGVYLEVSHASHPRERSSSVPQCWGLLYLCLHPLTQNDQIRRGWYNI